MPDFFEVVERSAKKDEIIIKPKFIIPTRKPITDLMTRAGDFYAVYDEETKRWSPEERVCCAIIDRALMDHYEKNKDRYGDSRVKIQLMEDADSGSIDRFHKYVQKQLRTYFHPLDEKLIFLNDEIKKEDYASKQLPYALVNEPVPAYEELISTLYSPEERKKLEWAIGSIVTGASKEIQKFIVMYGSAGTGKSTVLNIIQQLFEGYYSTFDAKALGSANQQFALEAFKTNPLVAIQHDGDLSKIEDNTRLNSLVSHELMPVNTKYGKLYESSFHSFLFMGTNKPVKITDAKSGIIRRLIDVSPTGDKLSPSRYRTLVHQIKFELGGIAWHCREVYLSDPGAYDDYIPVTMLGASNDFYNFVLDSYDVFDEQDGTTLKAAWEMYKTYCDEAKVSYQYPKRTFKEELKNYFKTFEERALNKDEARVWNWYSGFIFDKFSNNAKEDKEEVWLKFDCEKSIFDEQFKDCLAQLANEDEKPTFKWANVKTLLSNIDTRKTHYVRVPLYLIIIDFDLKDENGNKSFERNLAAALKWPKTYAELSKSGKGIHLHYIYEGDPTLLSRVFDDDIEIKVFTGNSSLRRKLTKCNDIPIATINSGLPLKKGGKVVNSTVVKSEKRLREKIVDNLNKKVHDNTTQSVSYILQLLDDAYNSGLKYNVSDLDNAVYQFALNSTHQKDNCLKMYYQMKFKSEEPAENIENYADDSLFFFDVEVYPNLFFVAYKKRGGNHITKLFNPTPVEIENMLWTNPDKKSKYKLVGFNNRRYDNHILYARLNGYSNERLFNLSQRIIQGDSTAFFSNAYDLSFTDIYDFSSKKQSLKKFEIELGIHHLELEFKWDEPVPEDQWDKVAEYCCNDVVATEAVFESRFADFVAREILADVAGMTVNDTTNTLTTRIIFGGNKKPQDQFNYRNLNELFPGYSFTAGKSSYRGETVGEGGYVYAEPGMYNNVVTLDVASMHPSSIIAENLFGDTYTARFKELLDARIAIKHKDYDKAKKMLNGVLAKYLNDDSMAKALSQALKIAINSVYGLTAARFANPFKDPRNIDNIVAKRGALFMINLKHEVQDRGFRVVHIKTDSIKIENPTIDIINFVTEYGKQYGYSFEIEHKFDRICLVNDAVYIAKCAEDDPESPNEWTATGTQFAVPYVFKTLFTREPIEFGDLCETKSTTSSLYLDLNEGLNENEHAYRFVGKVGEFCPIKDGCGGGELFREKDGKYYAVGGTKGYRWLESENVRQLNKEDCIDKGYYISLVDDAIKEISKYGDFEQFTA